MKPQIIYLRDVLSASTNDLNQVSCTLEMVLDHIFDFDPADLDGDATEQERALQMVETYPMWREVLALAWGNLVGIRDRMADACMTVESGKAKMPALSDALQKEAAT